MFIRRVATASPFVQLLVAPVPGKTHLLARFGDGPARPFQHNYSVFTIENINKIYLKKFKQWNKIIFSKEI